MFALNSMQPQLVLSLTQLTNTWSAARTLASSWSVQRSGATLTVTAPIEAASSAADVVERIQLSLNDLGLHDLAAGVSVEALSPILDTHHAVDVASRLRSDVSTQSFFENKNGFTEQELWTATFGGATSHAQRFKVTLPNLSSATFGFTNQTSAHAPRRGFKTRRSVTKTGMGHQREESDAPSPMESLRDTVLGRLAGRAKTAPARSDRFKSLLADAGDASPAAQDRLRVAFAEGYTARADGGGTGSGGATDGWPRRALKLVWYGLFAWLLLQLVQNYGAMGGNMKLNVLKGDRYEVNPEDINVHFVDIKGVDEAKQELSDVVEFLRDPARFRALGAKLPKGVLLVGPPGIGKTLLARAVAGEASVPFFHASGSEFDEIFVGTGAKRVRQLFDAAKARAPCVVFIDEIDTVGAKRTSSQIHPYANQTINQLLSEMDGFKQNDGVIVLGATNRRDNLDPALLRPGRFDVEVRVFPPDMQGRKDILDHYMSKVKMGEGIDSGQLARGTTGCTGADLENMVNQAALKAAMDGEDHVTMEHLEYARDKILMGPEKKKKIPDLETNTCTAYHEAGHTLVAYFTKDSVPLHKVTIVPRGSSLGHTSFVPEKEEYNLTKAQLLARMDVAMGGRVAEEVIYGQERVTTGAGADFQTATAIATAMVKKFGMSEKVGVRVFQEEEMDGGLSFFKVNDLSPAQADVIDAEIRRFLQESYDRAKAILKSHATEHRAVASALLKYETLTSSDVERLVDGRELERDAS